MRSKSNKSTSISTVRVLAVLLLAFCLTFLTALNYFVYPSGAQTEMAAGDSSDSGDDGTFPSSSGPTEEKASSGFSLLEEFLHENRMDFDFARMNGISQHKLAETENIEMVHIELISPPPKA